jgi:hypothetical protein
MNQTEVRDTIQSEASVVSLNYVLVIPGNIKSWTCVVNVLRFFNSSEVYSIYYLKKTSQIRQEN